MALEEANLVFTVDAGGIGRAPLDAEMVPHFSGVDRSFCLGNQFRASHRLAVPVCRTVEGELCALLGAGVCRVLVAGRQVHVAGDRAGSVDIVLVWADLVTP